MNQMRKYKIPIIAFCMAFIPRVVLCLTTIPVRTISDEVSTISWAAYFAGLDWNEVVSNAGYYGFGMTALFSILFRVFSDPILIYRIMLIVCSLFQSFVSIIAYAILKNDFNVKDQKMLCIVSAMSSYIVVTRGMIVYNESILILLSWIIAFMLLKLHKNIEKKRKKVFLTLILSLILIYSLTIHTRALTYWIGLGAVCIIYFLIYRKWIVSLPTLVTSLTLGYGIAKYVIMFLQTNVWLLHGEGKIRNASISTSGLYHLFNPQSWFAWVSIVLGQLNTISVFTGGFIIVVIVVSWMIVWKLVLKRKEYKDKINAGYVLLISFFGVCIISTIFAQSLSWLYQVVLAIGGGYSSQEYGLKAVTYVRYFGPYVGPIMLTGFVFVYKYTGYVKNHIFKFATLFVFLQFFWNACIIPYVHTNSVANEVYLPFFLGNNYEIKTRYLSYFSGTIICTMLFVCFCVLIHKEKILLIAEILLLLLMYQYGYNAWFIDRNVAVHNYEYIDKTYETLVDIRKQYQLPYELYVDDTRNMNNDQLFYLYQVYFPQNKIKIGLPETIQEDAIVITNSTHDKTFLLNEGFKCIELDISEYLFVRGDKYVECLEKLGLEPKDFLALYYEYDGKEISTNLYRNSKGEPISKKFQGFLTYGPYVNLYAGTYEVIFDLVIDDASNNDILGLCNISSDSGWNIIKEKELISEGNRNKKVKIKFTTEEVSEVEFRVFVEAGKDISVKKITCKRIGR